MQQKKIKELVNGAMMLALFGILVLFDTYTGSMLNVILFMLMPLPLLVYGLKNGLKASVILWICEMILALFLGLPETIFYALVAGLVSFVMIHGSRRHWSSQRLFLATLVMMIIAELASMTLLAGLFGYDIEREYTSLVAYFPTLANWVRLVIPLTAFVLGLMETYVLLNLAEVVCLRLKLSFVEHFHFVYLHFSKRSGLVLLLGCLGFLCPFDLAVFVGIICYILLGIQGLSFLCLWAIFAQKRYAMLVFLLSLFIPVLNLYLVVFGLVDIFSEKRYKIMYNKG